MPVVDEPDEDDSFRLVVEHANTTGLEAFKRRAVVTRAQILLACEVGIPPLKVADVSRWLAVRGWKSLIAPSQQCGAGATSGGAVICVRDVFGLREAPGGKKVLVDKRVVYGIADIPGWENLHLTEAYFVVGEGLREQNLGIMATIGKEIERCRPNKYFMAADFNMPPEAVKASGFPTRVGIQLFVPPAGSSTCVSPKSSSLIDYGGGSQPVSQSLETVKVLHGAGTRPHRPVEFTFKPVRCLYTWTYLTPETLPIARPFGPAPEPLNWDGAKAAALAVDMARSATWSQAKSALDAAYREFAGSAERSIARAVGVDLRHAGVRGLPPRPAWKKVMRHRTPRDLAGDRQHVYAGWRALDDELKELVRLVDAAACTLASDECKEQAEEAAGQLADFVPDGTGASAELDATAASARRLAANARAAYVAGVESNEMELWKDHADGVAEDVATALDPANLEAEAEGRESWDNWLEDGMSRSAKALHRLMKVPVEWQPTAVTRRSGELSAAPQAVLEDYEDTITHFWEAEQDERDVCKAAPRQSVPRKALSKLSPADLRMVGALFAKATGTSFDGFHPRHFLLLEDRGLEALSDLYEASEMLGDIPKQSRLLSMLLIEKPKSSGFRNITLFSAFYRTWERSRRDTAQVWLLQNDRPWRACGGRRSPEDTVWRQAIVAEASAERGGAAGGQLIDIRKYYERIRLELLFCRAVERGVDPILSALAIGCSCWARSSLERCGLQRVAFRPAHALRTFSPLLSRSSSTMPSWPGTPQSASRCTSTTPA